MEGGECVKSYFLFSRLLQIQHQSQPQLGAPQPGPAQNPLLFLTQHHPPSPPSTVFASSSMFDNSSILPAQPAPVALQHNPWQQVLDSSTSSCSSSSSGCSSSSSSCFSSLSPVASAAYLLEARLHISQQPPPHLHTGIKQQPPSAGHCTFLSAVPKATVWRMTPVPSTDSDMQDLGRSAQQQLSSCVMVK